MKTITSIFFFFYGFAFLSQSNKLEWGSLAKPSSELYKVMALEGNDFVTLRGPANQFASSYRLEYRSNLEVLTKGNISIKLENGIANFENALTIGNRIYVLLNDVYEKTNSIYIQEYTADLKPIDIPRALVTIEFDSRRNKGSFFIEQSKDKNYFVLLWEIPGQKEERDRYGFKIFDKNLVELNSGDYKLPFEGANTTIDQHILSNSGDYFISVTEYFPIEKKGIFRKEQHFKAVHLLQVHEEGLEDFVINMEEKRVEALQLETNDAGLFTAVGVYGDKGTNGAKGLFHLFVDFKKKQITHQGFEDFSEEFITKNWNEKQLEKANRDKMNGKGNPLLHNFVMRDVFLTAEGNLVGSIEQYYTQVVSYTDSRGYSRSTTYYYYNDIICFKIKKDGGFEWINRIPKNQASVNDGGFYSSYFSFLEKDQLKIIFNDHLGNYDREGEAEDVINYSFSTGKKNAVGMLSVDLETGNYDRRALFKGKDEEAIIIPRFFKWNTQKDQILFYARFGRKERFGRYYLSK